MILVVGATGTVGRRVIDALLSNPQIPVRALARGKSDWTGSLLPGFRRRGVDVVVGDVRSESTVSRAVKGCTAIINCTGVMRARPGDDLESINVEGVANLIQEGQEAGVQRFIQLSCLGATEHATGRYFGCKWDAEDLVKKSKFYWTIFRPSLIFDEDSVMMNILNFWVGRSPITVVVGSGLNRFQPISATDVADCIAKSVYDKDTVGKVYDLPGADTYELQNLLALVAEHQEHPLRTLRLASFIGVPLAGLFGKLNPDCPIDNNVMNVFTSDMIADAGPMLQKFQFTPRSFSDCLKQFPKPEPKTSKVGSLAGKSLKSLQKSSARASKEDDDDEEDVDDEEELDDEDDDDDEEVDNRSKKTSKDRAKKRK